MRAIRNIRTFFAIGVFSLLAACGGGGGDAGQPAVKPTFEVVPGTVGALGYLKVGGRTETTITIKNTSSAVANLSNWEGLPAGVTADGSACKAVSAGANCVINLTFEPKSDLPSTVFRVSFAGASNSSGSESYMDVAAGSENRAAMSGNRPGLVYWEGYLPSVNVQGQALVFRRVAYDAALKDCTVVVEGDQRTALLGKKLWAGATYFYPQADGVVSIGPKGETLTTFRNPQAYQKCTQAGNSNTSGIFEIVPS